ncbi:hypothetical protein, partial [Methyloglobulus sp.]|uniref:hypothetical protein n=1 Tax=Methyloglobulus sp. TaxID=2518622 RepID=UPI0039896112
HWLRNDSTRCRNALHFHYAKKRFVKTPSPIASGDYSTPVSQRMPNLAGKAYALSVLSPLKPWTTWLNQIILIRGRLQASNDSDLKN